MNGSIKGVEIAVILILYSYWVITKIMENYFLQVNARTLRKE